MQETIYLFLLQLTLLETKDIRSAIIGTKLDKCSSVIIVTFLINSSSLFVVVFLTMFSKLSDCLESCKLSETFLDVLGILLVSILCLSCVSKLLHYKTYKKYLNFKC